MCLSLVRLRAPVSGKLRHKNAFGPVLCDSVLVDVSHSEIETRRTETNAFVGASSMILLFLVAASTHIHCLAPVVAISAMLLLLLILHLQSQHSQERKLEGWQHYIIMN